MFEERESYAPSFLLILTMAFLFSIVPDFLYVDEGLKQRAVSFLGFLPISFPISEKVLVIGYSCFVGAALLWILSTKYKVFFSGLSVLSFLVTTALYYESKAAFNHTIILSTQGLIVLFLYQIFYKDKFRLFKKSLTPRWFFDVPIFFIVIHYFGAGILKIYESGFSWANGTSFQLWVYVWGEKVGFLKELIVHNKIFASSIQISTLVFELSTPLLFFRNEKIRLFFFIPFFIFHILIEYLFQYGFYPNLILIFTVLVIPFIECRIPPKRTTQLS